MMHLGFDIKVQIIRVFVTSMLWFIVDGFEVTTAASELDKAWLLEFFSLMLAFFIFINCVFILAIAADAP